ncbi:MAG: alanine racemase [Bacteroidales bacterium]|nr:alanine racemase [Bacteroidales bacterium]MCF8405941.1 alanine racemase [Bacteroidales bacterium]
MNFNGKRKTAAIVDLNHIKKNLQAIKSISGNSKICAIVKANGYGHGASVISNFIEKTGLINSFGVATVEEGIELREAGAVAPILLLGPSFKDQFEISIINNLTITIVCLEDVIELNNVAITCQKEVKVHLKIDTGMGRIGADPDRLEPIVNELKKSTNILLEGVFSHFSDSSNIEYSKYQINRFKTASSFLENTLGRTLIKHMANSGALLNIPDSFFDMVRPGILLYGYKPFNNSVTNKNIHPSMKLRTEISFIKHAKKGTTISYGANTFTKEDCYIATIPVGYADGISRSMSNKMKLRINGKTYNQIGTITMDQIMINLGQDYYKPGTEVLIFDYDFYTVNDYAETSNTIPYEVTCGISKRVLRYYVK